MPIYLPAVLDRATAVTPDADRASLERTVREVIAAVGLEVNERTGEVENPADGAYRRASDRAPMRTLPYAPRQQNVRWYGGRRR